MTPDRFRPAEIARRTGTTLGSVFTGIRPWIVGVAAFVGVIAVAGVALMATGEQSAQPPRVRVSVPGLETDLFAEESGEVSDVIVFEGTDQLQAAFNADAGHPRLILLVDLI